MQKWAKSLQPGEKGSPHFRDAAGSEFENGNSNFPNFYVRRFLSDHRDKQDNMTVAKHLKTFQTVVEIAW